MTNLLSLFRIKVFSHLVLHPLTLVLSPPVERREQRARSCLRNLLLGVPAEAGGFFEGGLLTDAHAAGFFEQHDFEIPEAEPSGV